jgi:hypothetical protein
MRFLTKRRKAGKPNKQAERFHVLEMTLVTHRMEVSSTPRGVDNVAMAKSRHSSNYFGFAGTCG